VTRRWVSHVARAGAVATLLGFTLAGAGRVAARPAHAPVTVQIWWSDWGHPWTDLMVKATDTLYHKEHPDITVKWTFFPNISQKLLTAAAAGTVPDVAYTNSSICLPWAIRGALQPLTPYIKNSKLDLSKFAPAVLPYYTWNGTVWALPTDNDDTALSWNKDAFKAAGLNPNQPPRTIADIDRLNARLFTYDAHKNIVRAGFFPDTLGFQYWGLAFGGSFYDTAHHKITANDPHNVQALQWLIHEAQTWGGADKEDRFRGAYAGSASPADPFYTGRVAMSPRGFWEFNTMQKFVPKTQFGFAPYPIVPSVGPRYWVTGTWGEVIPKGSAHPQAGWDLAYWMTATPDSGKVLADTLNLNAYLPVLDQWYTETMKLVGSHSSRAYMKVWPQNIVPNTKSIAYATPVNDYYDSTLAREVTKALHGKETAQQALDTVTTQVQAQLDGVLTKR